MALVIVTELEIEILELAADLLANDPASWGSVVNNASERLLGEQFCRYADYICNQLQLTGLGGPDRKLATILDRIRVLKDSLAHPKGV